MLRAILLPGLLWLSMTPTAVLGQQADPQAADTLVIASFDDLLSAVATHNQDIQSARTRSERARSRIRTEGTLPDPSVALGVSPFPVHTARGEQVVQLRVEQMLPWPGKRRLQRKMAEMEAAMGREDVFRIQAQVMLEAVHSAIAVERSERLMDVTRRFRERLERFEDIAVSRYETGEGEQQHIWKLQLAVAAQDQAMKRLEEQRLVAVASLQEEVQRPVMVAHGAFADDAPPPTSVSAEDRAELKSLQAGLERARLSRELAGLADRPDWGVSATWMAMTESSIPASSDGRDALGIGIMVRVPLGRSEQHAHEEMARLQEVELEQRRNDFLASWESMWREQSVRLASIEEQIRHLDETLIPLSEAMLASSVSAYAFGRSGFLDLLDAERSAFELQQQRIELQSRQAMTQWTRLRISGQWDALSLNDESR